MLGHICIINAPYVFRMIWALVKNMIDVRTQTKIEVRASSFTRSYERRVPYCPVSRVLQISTRDSIFHSNNGCGSGITFR